MLGQTSDASTVASAVRAARRSSRRNLHDPARSVSTPRSQTPSTATFRLNPLWPELPQRNYAIGPIEPGASGSSSESEAASSAPTRSAPLYTRSAEDLAGEAIELQELELADLVHQRQHERISRGVETERQRHQDWERDQYYIRLSEEARRVTQMQHQQQRTWSRNGTTGDRYQRPASPLSDQPSWTQHQTDAAPSGSREPREPQHKVYLLNCKHCGNFLSDRGMKAVLLLRPNITLYSTDAVPNQCGPYYSPSAFHGGVDPLEPPIERTCNCLTQSLGCYGCGNQVGYSILSPCDQCTSSVQKHQRSSNGHRTVLHCSEISVRERRYVPGEPGVRAASYECAASDASTGAYAATRRRGSPRVRGDYAPDRNSYPDFYDVEEDDDIDQDKTDVAAQAFYQHQQHGVDQPHHHHRDGRSARSSTRASSGNGKEARMLRRGDVVYWTDLISGGERTQPFDPDPILDMPAAGR